METISHSLPKKTPYDDVLAARPKLKLAISLSPRDEDYSEIFQVFHASRGSSIPLLALSPVEMEMDMDPHVYLDVRSSGFDYSEVFGCSNGFDFAVSYDQLFKPRDNDNDDSSHEAWYAYLL